MQIRRQKPRIIICDQESESDNQNADGDTNVEMRSSKKKRGCHVDIPFYICESKKGVVETNLECVYNAVFQPRFPSLAKVILETTGLLPEIALAVIDYESGGVDMHRLLNLLVRAASGEKEEKKNENSKAPGTASDSATLQISRRESNSSQGSTALPLRFRHQLCNELADTKLDKLIFLCADALINPDWQHLIEEYVWAYRERVERRQVGGRLKAEMKEVKAKVQSEECIEAVDIAFQHCHVIISLLEISPVLTKLGPREKALSSAFIELSNTLLMDASPSELEALFVEYKKFLSRGSSSSQSSKGLSFRAEEAAFLRNVDAFWIGRCKADGARKVSRKSRSDTANSTMKPMTEEETATSDKSHSNNNSRKDDREEKKKGCRHEREKNHPLSQSHPGPGGSEGGTNSRVQNIPRIFDWQDSSDEAAEEVEASPMIQLEGDVYESDAKVAAHAFDSWCNRKFVFGKSVLRGGKKSARHSLRQHRRVNSGLWGSTRQLRSSSYNHQTLTPCSRTCCRKRNRTQHVRRGPVSDFISPQDVTPELMSRIDSKCMFGTGWEENFNSIRFFNDGDNLKPITYQEAFKELMKGSNGGAHMWGPHPTEMFGAGRLTAWAALATLIGVPWMVEESLCTPPSSAGETRIILFDGEIKAKRNTSPRELSNKRFPFPAPGVLENIMEEAAFAKFFKIEFGCARGGVEAEMEDGEKSESARDSTHGDESTLADEDSISSRFPVSFFAREGWDCLIVCLRRDRQSIAFLAATDV
eukprot:CAMPEP_0184488732 /NCGR_PEP_ID=MMETSP0113_2-20130426/13113_1 /TAXON_ID=91329 /ORGANISM="Norrisiella sphaerica, Strain BC52" /LENGTH=759 /DNA_ID=CAMNT_0026871699 /DNA_START=156 /DNA_END=2435 /DNA_ORIENTATION=+